MGSGNAMTTARPIAVFRSAATLKRPFPKPCSAVPLPCSCSVRRRAEAWALPMPSRETFDFMVELRQRRSEESPAAARRMDAALAGILREPAMKPELQRNAQDNTLRVWAAVSGAALENTKAERALLLNNSCVSYAAGTSWKPRASACLRSWACWRSRERGVILKASDSS